MTAGDAVTVLRIASALHLLNVPKTYLLATKLHETKHSAGLPKKKNGFRV